MSENNDHHEVEVAKCAVNGSGSGSDKATNEIMSSPTSAVSVKTFGRPKRAKVNYRSSPSAPTEGGQEDEASPPDVSGMAIRRRLEPDVRIVDDAPAGAAAPPPSAPDPLPFATSPPARAPGPPRLSALTTPSRLKAECRDRNLPSRGKRTELISRLGGADTLLVTATAEYQAVQQLRAQQMQEITHRRDARQALFTLSSPAHKCLLALSAQLPMCSFAQLNGVVYPVPPPPPPPPPPIPSSPSLAGVGEAGGAADTDAANDSSSGSTGQAPTYADSACCSLCSVRSPQGVCHVTCEVCGWHACRTCLSREEVAATQTRSQRARQGRGSSCANNTSGGKSTH